MASSFHRLQRFIFENPLNGLMVQDALNGLMIQDALNGLMVQDALNGLMVQDALNGLMVHFHIFFTISGLLLARHRRLGSL